MKKILQPTLSLLALSLFAQPVMAVDIGEGHGTMDISLKALHVLGGNDNNFDPNTGSAEMLTIQYKTPSFNHLKLGLGAYLAGDFFNLTDWDDKVARGLFISEDGAMQGQIGEAYLEYTPEKVHAFAGRMLYKSPLTTSASSTVPDFHTVFGVSTTALSGVKIGVAQITEMSLGARSMTNFGLIGEGTPTAGTGVNPLTIGQAEFHNIGVATLGKNSKDTAGISVFNVEYSGVKNLTLAAWDYYAHDIANNVYLQADKTLPLKGKKVTLSAQYLNQTDVGDKLAGELDYNLYGLKVSVGNPTWSAYVAANQSSGSTYMLNAWGGDPGYTSSIFSRNQYRENVTAYKVGGQYKVTPKWILSAGYAHYGQSDTLKTRTNPNSTAQTDATELDLSIAWKPSKNATLSVFHANRVSEYDGLGGNEFTQAHTRFVGTYTF